MEKILFAIDGSNLNHHALDFACYLADMEHASITVVSLENLVAIERPEVKEAHFIQRQC